MNRMHLTEVAGTIAGAVLGVLLVAQASAQGQGSGARPNSAAGGAGNAGGLGNPAISVDRAWPRGPEVQPPSRLPQDKAFGEKGADASAKKAENASGGCAKAESAIASAGTGGATEKGQGGDAGAEGRATAAAAVCAGPGTEGPADSAAAPGHTGQTGHEQATQRADEHAKAGLDEAQTRSKDEDDVAQEQPKNELQ